MARTYPNSSVIEGDVLAGRYAGWQLPSSLNPPVAMASAPTVTTGASVTLARRYYAATNSASHTLTGSMTGGPFTVTRTVAYGISNSIAPSATYTSGLTAAPNALGNMQVSFMTDAADVEIGIYSTTGTLFRVDGEYVSLTPTTTTSTDLWTKLAFGSSKFRRIDVIGHNLSFVGVATATGDTILPAPKRGPRVLCLGDSFTQPGIDNWPIWLSDWMGWDDIWAMGVGGSGWSANTSGTTKRFNERILTDVVPWTPDVVFLYGSLNDSGHVATTVAANVSSGVSQLLDRLPNCLVIGGYNGVGGVEEMSTAALNVMDATRAAFLSAGGVWLNPMEMPLTWTGSTPVAYLSTTHSAGRVGANPNSAPYDVANSSTGVSVTGVAGTVGHLPVGATLEIGQGATRERVVVNGRTQINGTTYSYSFQGALQYTHASGAPVTVVGPAYLTGTGRVGTTTSWGNSDTLVSSDNTHPTVAGQRALAGVQATLLRNHLAGLV